MEGDLKPSTSYTVHWTETALEYYDAAMTYVAEESQQRAEALARRIRINVDALAGHPEIGRPGRCKGTRELVISGTPYIVPYRVVGNKVQVLRIVHGARKWPIRMNAIQDKGHDDKKTGPRSKKKA